MKRGKAAKKQFSFPVCLNSRVTDGQCSPICRQGAVPAFGHRHAVLICTEIEPHSQLPYFASAQDSLSASIGARSCPEEHSFISCAGYAKGPGLMTCMARSAKDMVMA